MPADPNDFGYAGFRFSWGEHICGIFDNRAQQMEIMGAFVATGLRSAQRCLWVGAPESCKVLRTYPIVILGDAVRQNPFYIASPPPSATPRDIS